MDKHSVHCMKDMVISYYNKLELNTTVTMYYVLQPLKIYMWCFKLCVAQISFIYKGRISSKLWNVT